MFGKRPAIAEGIGVGAQVRAQGGDHGPVGRGRVVARGAAQHRNIGRAGQVIEQAGLADPGLTGYEHESAVPAERQPQLRPQAVALHVAPDQMAASDHEHESMPVSVGGRGSAADGDAPLSPQTATGSSRTITVSATLVISSADMPVFPAWRRIASGLTPS